MDSTLDLLRATFDWLFGNKEWVFSGVGGSIVLGVFGWIFYRQRKNSGTRQVLAKNVGAVAGGDIRIGASNGGTVITGEAKGHVYVTNVRGISEEQYRRLAEELGVTRAALKNFFKILEERQVPPEDLDSRLRDIAGRYRDLQERLRAFSSEDPDVVALKREASEAIEAGDFARAEGLLNEASKKDVEAASRMQEAANERLLSAAASKAENGDLKMTQLAYAEVADYYRQAAELVPPESKVVLAKYLNAAGMASYEAGKYAEAEPLIERALAIREKTLGPRHPNVAQSLNNLAALYDDQGRYAEAEPLYRRALAIDEKALGSDHPGFAIDLNNLAELYRDQGRTAEAEPLFKRALAIWEKALGPEHPNIATGLENYAALLRETGRGAEAEKLEARAQAIKAKHGEKNP